MKIEFTNVRSFEKSLRKFAKKTRIAPGIVATRVAFQAFGGVIDRTPVDTGWARASWNIAEGSADLSIPPKPGEGTVLPAPIARPPITTSDFPTWYVTNNLPYIGELEAGKSIQAGKGYMVQRTLVELEAEINLTIRNLDL